MAEAFMFNIAQKVLEKLVSRALEEVLLAWGVKTELQKLQNTLSSIQAVLLDAEEQQSNNHLLEDWLGKLKDVIYEIDEVLNEFEIKALQQKVYQAEGNRRKVRNFFSRNSLAFRIRMGHKIKEIRERLDQIATDRNRFNLSIRLVDRPIIHRERDMTHSFLHAPDVIGRDEDKEHIVRLLMCSVDHENVSVIPIVGIGGLGKTTLAKMVYNDERIVKNFDMRMWVCVSEEFELKKLIGKIIKSATGADCENLDIEHSQIQIRETLSSKKYLLILDDVWNREHMKWVELKNLLSGGSPGSRIIVTTRDHTVSSIMCSIEPYILEGLPHDKCLSLLEKMAFKEGQLGINNQKMLMEIGEEIVRKCKGVPLAVRTLGSMLYMKSDKREWMFVRDSEIWELEQKKGDILPALRLSYDQLPTYLKQCFAYCSVFPKDGEIMSTQLIHFWMAQGLIQSTNQNKDEELEDIGIKYFHELCSVSFFQDVVDFGHVIVFKMHDLVHDLALLVAKPEHATIDIEINLDGEPTRKKNMAITKKVRHVSFCNNVSDSAPSQVPTGLLELNNLHSIHFQFGGVGPTSKSFVQTCILRFRCLRLLDLGDSSFETLPSSIGRLKHLRYLNLNNNRRIKSLPNSICMLLCLQTLLLLGCKKLEKLPVDFRKLISLRCLWLTTQERRLSMKGMFGSSSTISLRFLWISQCGNLESLFEDDDGGNGVRRLTNLQTLVIHDCNCLARLPQGIRYLTTLENLTIGDCQNLDLMDAPVGKDGRIGSSLRSLQSLMISGLPKLETIPQWLVQSVGGNSNLKHIAIEDCINFWKILIWLTEDLKSLQKLWIHNCPLLTDLPYCTRHLTTLTEIRISQCPELIRRCKCETGSQWKRISHIPHIYLDGIKI